MPHPTHISIRDARPDDLRAIGRLGAQLVRLHHGFDSRRFVSADEQVEHAYIASLAPHVERPHAMIFVAEIGGVVVGFAHAGLEPANFGSLRGAVGAVYDIAVDALSQGQGIGRLLLDTALAALEERGAPRVLLSTAEQNAIAQRLFTRAGFRRTMIEMTRELGSRRSES